MEFLRLLPDAQGYSWKPSTAVANRTEVEGGFDVRRQEFTGVTNFFSLTFTLNPDDYNYLDEFVRAYFRTPAWFHMLLLAFPLRESYPLERHACQIVPGSYKLTRVEGHRYTVSMQVEGYLDPAEIPTTHLYPILNTEALQGQVLLTAGRTYIGTTTENLASFSPAILDGELRVLLQEYGDWPPESLQANAPAILDGELRVLLREYSEWPPDELESLHISISSGTIKVALVVYGLWPSESIQATPSITSGTLS